MSVLGIDHVQIACPPGAESAAREFYGGLLGLTELEKPAALRARGGAWFGCGAHQLHVGVEDPFTPARKAHAAFIVDALDDLARRLGAAGHEPRWDTAIPGVRRFYVDDPWGNRVELVALARARADEMKPA